MSAIIFYLFFLLLWKSGVIPSPAELLEKLESLFQARAYSILFFSTILEGLVYIGLYFPGSTIILLSVLLSDGKPTTFLLISLVVALALTITSIFNYLSGRFFGKEQPINIKEKLISRGMIIAALHPDALAFYFFKRGHERKSWKEILGVPIVMVPYGFLLATIFYPLKSQLRAAIETPGTVILILSTWLIIAFLIENRAHSRVNP